jgi:hypothetical protein
MFEPPPVSEVDVLTTPDAVAAELATSVPRPDDMVALLRHRANRCSQPSSATFDHHQPFADGGTTDPDNLSAL